MLGGICISFNFALLSTRPNQLFKLDDQNNFLPLPLLAHLVLVFDMILMQILVLFSKIISFWIKSYSY